jgi:hypothetical protein
MFSMRQLKKLDKSSFLCRASELNGAAAISLSGKRRRWRKIKSPDQEIIGKPITGS